MCYEEAAFCSSDYWELSKKIFNVFPETNVVLFTTKDNLMGKVWGKTFLWCERPWTTLTEIATSLIHSSVRDWLDNPLNAADIDHVEFRVCLVSEPLDRVVFSKFCTLREKCFILQLFSKWKKYLFDSGFFFSCYYELSNFVSIISVLAFGFVRSQT